MALKTMSVIQLASGRTVTINAKDFDNEKYALPGEPAKPKAMVEPPPAPPAPPVPPVEPPMDVDTMLSALSSPKVEEPKVEEPPVPRRRGR